MKNCILTLLATLVTFATVAQVDTSTTKATKKVEIIIQTSEDTTTISGETEVIQEDEEEKKDNFSLRFGMVDIGISTYIPAQGSLNDLPDDISYMEQRLVKSTNININLVRHRLALTKDRKLNFEYGLTFSSNKYFFEESFRMQADQASFQEARIATEENFKKNRLTANYLTLPINIGVISNPEELSKAFKFSVGAYGGFLIGSNHKIKGGDLDQKIKTKDDFNLTQFIWGLEGRIGFGPLNLYTQYFMTSMFRDDRGPDLNQFNIGITILPY